MFKLNWFTIFCKGKQVNFTVLYDVLSKRDVQMALPFHRWLNRHLVLCFSEESSLSQMFKSSLIVDVALKWIQPNTYIPNDLVNDFMINVLNVL